jgi:hypothetical protein
MHIRVYVAENNPKIFVFKINKAKLKINTQVHIFTIEFGIFYEFRANITLLVIRLAF